MRKQNSGSRPFEGWLGKAQLAILPFVLGSLSSLAIGQPSNPGLLAFLGSTLFSLFGMLTGAGIALWLEYWMPNRSRRDVSLRWLAVIFISACCALLVAILRVLFQEFGFPSGTFGCSIFTFSIYLTSTCVSTLMYFLKMQI
jgi:hypothetical protein